MEIERENSVSEHALFHTAVIYNHEQKRKRKQNTKSICSVNQAFPGVIERKQRIVSLERKYFQFFYFVVNCLECFS